MAIHRGHGLWTHVYEVVNLDGAFSDEIRLIRVMPGDRRNDARSWVLARRGQELPAWPKGGDDASAGIQLTRHRSKDASYTPLLDSIRGSGQPYGAPGARRG